MLLQHLYLSQRSPRLPLSDIDELARTSRGRNAEFKVTGALLFDGTFFAQYLEGPEAALERLVQRIALDPRHEELRVLHHGALDGERLFPGWNMVYAVADELQSASDGLSLLGELSGADAVAQFIDWVPEWCRGG